jgi:hypothetical protein
MKIEATWQKSESAFCFYLESILLIRLGLAGHGAQPRACADAEGCRPPASPNGRLGQASLKGAEASFPPSAP